MSSPETVNEQPPSDAAEMTSQQMPDDVSAQSERDKAPDAAL